MNNRAITLSLIMAVLAIFFVESYVSSIEEETQKKFGTEVLVISAKTDIKEMETLNETMVELRKIPKRYLEPNALSFEQSAEESDAAQDIKRLAGLVAMVPIKKGEQITYNKITEPSLRTGLSPQITPGKRGATLQVNEVSGVGKLVKPGDRVDVIAVIDVPAQGRTLKVAKTVLQDVVVLAVGRRVTNNLARLVEKDPFGGRGRVRSLVEDDTFSSVTVEVDPNQAQMVALIGSTGTNTVYLSLRNNDDSERVPVGQVTTNDLMNVDSSGGPGSRFPAQIRR